MSKEHHHRGSSAIEKNRILWQNGNHQVLHNAGEDLTANLDEAPHGADMLERFLVVGTLM